MSGETKTPIVVVVIRVVVVAVGATRIRSSVVPRAAAQHIVGQFLFVITLGSLIFMVDLQN